MMKIMRSFAPIALALALSVGLLAGCGAAKKPENGRHEPLTIMMGSIQSAPFLALMHEKYPEVQLDIVSYTGSNTSGYYQYLLENGEVTDIMPMNVFSLQEAQQEFLLDLSGCSFLSNYKTADINQVTLDGSVYAVPMSASIIGLYYNKTLFTEHGWEVPQNFQELKALTGKIKEAGLDPVSAQFELSGNGFFDLFTMAKTNYLSTPKGLQWEQDFKAGNAAAAEGLYEAMTLIQELIDCGFLDAADTGRSYEEGMQRFYSREAAMLLNAGVIPRFTQNEDGTGDQYGIMPFYGGEDDNSVLISAPLCYYGLSKTLEEPGNEQKLEDALKVMEVLSTEEGQKSLIRKPDNYITPLKNEIIPENSPFHEVSDTIRSGHTSNLAYAGYEHLLIGVGDKVRDWVAGKCTGEDVLALIDQMQAEFLSGTLPVITTATRDFTMEETAQLQAEAFRQAAGTEIGLVSLGGYHDGYENYSGVCGKLFAGGVSQDQINAVVPGLYNDPICVLELLGADIKGLLEAGFVTAEGVDGFPYIPAGIIVTKDTNGKVKQIIMEDGSSFDEAAAYTVAVDLGGFTEEIGRVGSVKETELVVVDVVKDYMSAHSPLSPLESSIK
ncbi:extracellular solute-binding protein [Diplocloster hominis]|uniref:extracellular solute-binding protein n=1 Tax=Diplocloster hominis TaxID=3079010 RepID=UPI0031BBB0FF